MRSISGTPRSRQTGQSMVELVIVIPVLLFLILCVLQAVLLYRAKATVDYATFEAARAGALHGVDHGEMKQAFIRGIAPLYAQKPTKAGLAKAVLKAETDIRVMRALTLEVVSPTRAAWNTYKEKDFRNRDALPNDNLAFRDDRVRGAGVNLQDANLLKLRVTYHYELKIPFVDRVLGSFIKRSALIKPAHIGDNGLKTSWYNPITGNFFIPIDSYAIVRMQSPIISVGNLRTSH